MSEFGHSDVDDAAEFHVRDHPYPTSGSRNKRGSIGDKEKEGGYSEDEGEYLKAEDMASWAGQPAIKGSTESMRMALLTLSLIGLQYVCHLIDR